jgi:hypothetical protein
MSYDTSQLILAMQETVDMLNLYRATPWAAKIEDDIRLLERGDNHGAERFLSYFGGMGSLNDVWLCEENGHTVPKSAEKQINDQLEKLKTQAWELARGGVADAT